MDKQGTHSCATHDHHEGYFLGEFLHHLPYAIFSFALAFVILSILDVFGLIMVATTIISWAHP